MIHLIETRRKKTNILFRHFVSNKNVLLSSFLATAREKMSILYIQLMKIQLTSAFGALEMAAVPVDRNNV